ncbi:DinB family protein [Brevibacillus laterosporus]|uniref:DinB family protein n=1 Tax=Brevibacillus laterosporus TaxID=1465 RepID=A0AAP8QFJ4_BRELA|nr:DinB family protein [Brevibacillus laterosporus]PPB10741.1 DinB family protein [Brevibacillus laterosporus]
MNIHAVRAELIETVDGLSDTEINQRAVEGVWTIGQVLEHLYLTEIAVAHHAKKALSNEEVQIEPKPISLILDRSKRVQAPAPCEPTTEPKHVQDLLLKLESARTSLLAVYEGAESSQSAKKGFTHPAFGLLDINQWIEFVGFHEQRHLEQIKEIKAHLSV